MNPFVCLKCNNQEMILNMRDKNNSPANLFPRPHFTYTQSRSLNLNTHTVCWGLWWAGRTAGTWRRRTACVGTWCPPWGWVQTVSHGPGCRTAVDRTSSRTSPHPNPTSPLPDRSRCPPGPGERNIQFLLFKMGAFVLLDICFSPACSLLFYWTIQTAQGIQWKDRWARKYCHFAQGKNKKSFPKWT